MVQEAVASVLAQEAPGGEIIVVDDHSRDGVGEVLAARFPRVRVLRLAGGAGGPGAARNAGAAAASSGVIMFLDSDDLWAPDHAGRLLATLDRGFSVAYGPTRTLDLVQGGEFAIPAAGEEIEGDCFAALLRWCFLVPSAVALSRELFVRSGGFGAGDLGEDWEFFLSLGRGHHFGYAAGPPLTVRRLHHGSLCRLLEPARLLACLQRLAEPAADELPSSAADGRAGTAPIADRTRQAAVRARFAALARWTAARDENWATIQEWYLALQEEGLI